MRLDLANEIQIGDTVYNCFMSKLIVDSIHKDNAGVGNFHRIVFRTAEGVEYDSQDVYLQDLYGESDDEKSWVSWAKENQDFFETFDHIATMKEVYKVAFCNGFEYKRQITFEEMMQK